MRFTVREEGKGPDFVLEVASPNTWRENVVRKPGVYARLGVKVYFLFDPRSEYLTPRLPGYRLVDGEYEQMSAVESIDRMLTMRSEVLGLELRAKGEEMRFHDPATGEDLLSHGEEHATRLEESAARREEAATCRAAVARAETLEARVAELEALLRAKSC